MRWIVVSFSRFFIRIIIIINATRFWWSHRTLQTIQQNLFDKRYPVVLRCGSHDWIEHYVVWFFFAFAFTFHTQIAFIVAKTDAEHHNNGKIVRRRVSWHHNRIKPIQYDVRRQKRLRQLYWQNDWNFFLSVSYANLNRKQSWGFELTFENVFWALLSVLSTVVQKCFSVLFFCLLKWPGVTSVVHDERAKMNISNALLICLNKVFHYYLCNARHTKSDWNTPQLDLSAFRNRHEQHRKKKCAVYRYTFWLDAIIVPAAIILILQPAMASKIWMLPSLSKCGTDTRT